MQQQLEAPGAAAREPAAQPQPFDNLDASAGTFFGGTKVTAVKTEWRNDPKITIPNGKRFNKHGMGRKSDSEGIFIWNPDGFGQKQQPTTGKVVSRGLESKAHRAS